MGVGAGAGLAITDAAVIGGADAAIDAASVAALSSAAADVGAGVAAGAITGDVAAGLTADQFAAGLTADQIAGVAPIAGAADAATAAATLGTDAAAAAPAAAAPAAVAPAAAAPIAAPLPTTATGAVVPGAGALTGGAPAATAAGAAPAAAGSTAPAAITNLGAAASPDLTSAQFAAGLSPEQISGADLANTAATVGGGIGPSDIASPVLSQTVAKPAAQDLGIFDQAQTAKTALPASTGTAPPGLVDKALGKLGDAATSPGAIVGALGLGYQALNQPTVPKAAQAPAVTSAQLDLAKQATAGATALEAPLTTGVLPPGAQAAIDNATKAAKARVIGNYAARGMDVGKDAAGNYTNASLAQDLNAIDQQAAGQVFQYADQLYQQGLSQAQISESLYNAILQNTTAQNDTMSKAINNFVTAAAGGRPVLVSGATTPQPAS